MFSETSPAVAIGLIVGFYWARVLKLVIKTRRQTGRAANFVPPELLGRVLRIVWYPTVAAWVLVPWLYVLFVAAGFAVPSPMRLLVVAPWVRWPGVLLAAAALGATMVCWRKMGRSWRMGIDPGEKTSLITTGPFAFVRHPIYALSSVVMLGSVLAVCSWLMLVLGLVHTLLLQWEARREEKALVGVHGETYLAYMRQTGRFLPVPGRRVAQPAGSSLHGG